VERALAQGIVTTFLHDPHPGNLLTSWLGLRTGDNERKPDLNILHHDYSVVFTEPCAGWMEKVEASGHRPFLSLSSTFPVAAAFVAMLKSVRPELTPTQARQLLGGTSRLFFFEGRASPRTVDIGAVVETLTGRR
jgi:hypothetical protein